MPDAGKRVALWGAGSKGVTFLNSVPGASRIDTVIDINVRKQGKFVPGTGQRVSSPEIIAAERLDQIIIMNPNYVEEIRAKILKLGSKAKIIAV